MKIAIDLGHGVGSDRGAEGYILEETIINEVGSKVIAKLRALGHTVIETRPSSCSGLTNSLSQRCEKANNNNCDIFLSIHANAGGGVGTEIFTYKGREVDWARRILNNVVALGFRNRGIKGNSLYVTNHTSMTSALLEVCFVDTQSDVNLYKSIGSEKIADAIVKGLVGTTTSTTTTTNTNTGSATNTTNSNYNPHLKDLQQAYNRQYGKNIYVDGIRGNQTEEMLRTIILKVESRGDVVSWVQCRVGAGIDGIFGQETKNKVKEFQQRNNLTSDGIVGYNTLNKILELFR